MILFFSVVILCPSTLIYPSQLLEKVGYKVLTTRNKKLFHTLYVGNK